MRSGFLVNGYVRATKTRERLLLPSTPAVAQPQACKPSHQVEFRGPGITPLYRVRADPLVAHHEVVRGQSLRHHVVDVKRHCACIDADHADVLARWQSL